MKILESSPQTSWRSARGGAFTLVELLMVISVIAILASFTVGLARVASTRMKESRVRAELAQLVTAIDSYHASHGFYPPDNRNPNNAKDKRVNTVTNALFYELVGTVLTNADTVFMTKKGDEQIAANVVRSFFRTSGFANSGRDAKEVKSFLSPKEKQIGQISDAPDVDVLVAPVEWPLNKGFAAPFAELPVKFHKLNPWRYDASSTNRHNMKGFDLWAEYVVGNEIKVIGNWKD